jgi:hypothetical protein
MFISHNLVRRFRALYLPGNPESYVRMNKPGATSKYTKILDPVTRRPVPISDAALAAHLAGRATYAAPLIGADGMTSEAALDIDAGGEEAVRAALCIAADLGVSAYGLVSPGCRGGHHGGHIRIPLAESAAPEQARLLAEQIKMALLRHCTLASRDIEVYPTRKSLRLPFGRHTWTGKRGVLLLQDGTQLNLDVGETRATMAEAISVVETLTPNDTCALPPMPLYNAAVASSDAPQRGRSGNPIQDYIQTTNLLDWLISIGAHVAYRTRTGGHVLHCPCANHKHHDAHASLEVRPATNVRHGQYIAIGYSGGCVFETQPGRIINAFDAYCRWYGLDTRDALRRLYAAPRE